MHALGVGHPAYVSQLARLGYGLFDSALPTRDARHGRLYVLGTAGDAPSYVYANDNKHIKNDAPADPACDCLTCRRYALGYLHHLFKINDGLFMRLATIHNLRAMARLTASLRLPGHE
jgi:queuine tRNA-ribosyltransferase